MAKHVQLFHTPRSCTCGQSLMLADVPAHSHTVLIRKRLYRLREFYFKNFFKLDLSLTKQSCPDRKIYCMFCDSSVRAGPPTHDYADRLRGIMTEHEVNLTSSCLFVRWTTLLLKSHFFCLVLLLLFIAECVRIAHKELFALWRICSIERNGCT